MKRIRLGLFIALVLFVLFGIGFFSRLYTNILWFQEVGYLSIFSTIFWTKIITTLSFMLTFFIIAWSNIKIAQRLSPKNLEWYDEKTIFLNESGKSSKKVFRIATIVIAVLSFMFGTSATQEWKDILYYLHSVPFGIQDPVFNKDISFYIFKLPFLEFVLNWLFGTLIATIILTLVVYFVTQAISVLRGQFKINPNILQHLSGLLAALAIVWGLQYNLDCYSLLYSSRGVAVGAFYTDIHAQLPAYRILTVLSFIVAGAFLVNIQLRKLRIPIIAIALWVITAILVGGIYPEIVQRLSVKPNELAKEKPYIEYNIKFTNLAYNLDKIKEEDFPIADTLTRDLVNRNAPTIRNIRLWDHRPLKDTYKQLQVIRQYYDFMDVDIDRYHLGDEYVQIMLSAREISVPQSARTWINEKLIYTHGYGFAATRVNAVEQEGLPSLLVKDIPPVYPAGMKIDRPEIYFGESQSDYVLVKTKQKEFDYPKGNDNVYTEYSGKAGIPLNSYFRRLAFSYVFGDTDLVFTGTLSPQSRLIYRRDIVQRVKTIMPFISLDPDPYLVVANGKLFWMLDGYTKTDKYPYSKPFDNQFNYIRNSVKIVVDAYDGTVSFYVIDSKDPLIQAWSNIFPSAFQPFEKMPKELKSHIRYPEGLFRVQTNMYSLYHMRDPQVFYNQEDKWNVASEMFDTQQQAIEPYYVIMRLPDEPKEEFMLMVPFVPATKSNMIAWMTAKCDLPDYGNIMVYKFSKEKLVYGPMQIEARIDQDADISSQLTLWNQKGSKVIRGNLLVIPIEHSIVYVEPLYLKAEQSQIPELKRVIVAYGDKIAMEQTLEQALTAVFGGKATPTVSDQTSPQLPTTPANNSIKELSKQASQTFDKAQEKLKSGDWAGYGNEMQKLKDILKQMEKQ